ncbi:MAG: hypothetical protein IKJ30_01215 [Bacilli bacterium]|nr:hypothetical protein [Bacilli bacterium]
MNNILITNRTILVYKKREHNMYKGYWLWGSSFKALLSILLKEIEEDIGDITKEYMKSKINSIISIIDLERWIYSVNLLYKECNIKYRYYVYSNIEEAIERVKKNKGTIYFDYNKTFNGDCLKEE